jgi:glutamine amidotransferase
VDFIITNKEGTFMCRFAAYLGHPVLMEQVLVKPINSIVMQSISARESSIPTNGDGFGIGWYAPEIDNKPAVFTSTSPAWSDMNLLHLTSKVKSPCFFAHVRAASIGGVNSYNCHPFLYGDWMLMHNGDTFDFISVKRHLRHLLDDDIYHQIQGETDSEHIFALFLQRSKGQDLTNISVVADILAETLYEVRQLIHQFGKLGTSYFNICITDGKRIIASRYCTDKQQALTLHYSQGSQFVFKSGRYHMLKEGEKKACVLIASEKLTDIEAEWHDVPANHMLLIDASHNLELRALS